MIRLNSAQPALEVLYQGELGITNSRYKVKLSV
jgi:hypothetical protein